MRMSRFLCLFALLLCVSPIKAQDVFSDFKKNCPEASMSFCLKDLESGDTDLSYDSQRSLAPASVMKLLTTIACLDKYGPEHSFTTQIGYTGKIENGVLKGSLVIKASGDPTWNSKFFPRNDVFDKIISLLKANRIKKIAWGVIVDEGITDYSLPRTWIWEDIANYFGSPVKAINLYDNTYKLYFSSGKAGSLTQIESVNPEMHSLSFKNEVIASSVNRDDAWIFGGPNSGQRVVKGSIPQNRKSFIVKGSIPNTNEVFFESLRIKLAKYGIKCKKNLLIKNISNYKPLGEIKWPSLGDVVYYTNQKSVNLFAEALVKKIGSLGDYYSEKGLKVKGVRLYDGSGISRFNMLNAEFLTDVLVFASNKEYSRSLIKSLPKAGQTGTLKRFGRGTCLENNLIAKTGSMKGVRAYAGYLTISGKRKAFSCIVNNYTCKSKEVERIVQKILISLYE